MYQSDQTQFDEALAVQVSIVMPCLNEIESLPHCIANAKDALREIARRYNLRGEILIADNGSTDGSQALAVALGAHVVPVAERGYGAALIGGCKDARGRYILMGDCDGSYDFTDGVAMIGKLLDGHALCMGSRFDGGIEPGAMPWKNRWIGNPVLTGILNLFFRASINDAHCGLRAISKDCFERLSLNGRGMEFASEMVIKAALLKLPIAQVPATLSRDLRNRPPHLRPWRDGWRHLRYLLMLSPTWAFGVPAFMACAFGLLIFAIATMKALGFIETIPFGESWTVIGALLCCVGQMGLLIAVAIHLHGVREGFRRPRRELRKIGTFLTFESMALLGATMIVLSLIALGGIAAYWSASAYAALPTILPVTFAGTIGVCGLQTLFGAILLAVVSGNQADFLHTANQESTAPRLIGTALVRPAGTGA